MSRRRAPRWLLCAGQARVLRLHPGDTLLVAYQGHVSDKLALQLQRELEDQLGYGNEVKVVVLGEDPIVTVVRAS